jgi:hypothetical protein
MAMSGGKSAVPQWWTDQRQPQAHERLLGSIQFYRSKWEGGAHWESSEDEPRRGFDESLQARAPDEGQEKEWPGYDAAEARQGYLGRDDQRKDNRAAFEVASMKMPEASEAAILGVNERNEVRLREEILRESQQTRQNFEERDAQRQTNKKLAVEASSKLVKPRPGYVPIDTRQAGLQPQEKSDWYGRKNTCPW